VDRDPREGLERLAPAVQRSDGVCWPEAADCRAEDKEEKSHSPNPNRNSDEVEPEIHGLEKTQ